VLEVRRRARRAAKRCRVEQPARPCERGECREAGADLEPSRGDVAVRDRVAHAVQNRAEHDRADAAT